MPGEPDSTEQLRKGFYYYKDGEPPPIEPKQPETETRKTPDIHWNQITEVPAKDLKRYLDEQLEYATTFPTDQGAVQDYIILQAEAIRRATEFQRSWAKVLLQSPGLNPLAIHPTSRVAKVADITQKRQDQNQFLGDMRENMAILLFTRQGCSYCEQQRKILNNFVQQWGWKNIQEIDINEYPETAQAYGVELTPDIFLVGNVGDQVKTQRLAAGLTTGDLILKGIMDAYSYWFLGHLYQLPQDRQQDEMLLREIQARMEKGKEETEKQR